jgi:CBS domain containing-hemolysin-like protein
MDPDPLSFLIILICIIFIAVLSSSEVAFISLNRIKLRYLVEKGTKKQRSPRRSVMNTTAFSAP